MKSFTRNALLGAALLGAAGLVTSLPAGAASSTTVAETPAVKASKGVQLAQRPYDPSAGSVGFKKKKAKKKAKKK